MIYDSIPLIADFEIFRNQLRNFAIFIDETYIVNHAQIDN